MSFSPFTPTVPPAIHHLTIPPPTSRPGSVRSSKSKLSSSSKVSLALHPTLSKLSLQQTNSAQFETCSRQVSRHSSRPSFQHQPSRPASSQQQQPSQPSNPSCPSSQHHQPSRPPSRSSRPPQPTQPSGMAAAPPTAGSAVYSPLTLSLYDMWVLDLSNSTAWKCSTADVLLPFFAAHMARDGRHLDVGVGTGYYPAAALSIPTSTSKTDTRAYPVMGLPETNEKGGEIVLLDINESSLQKASTRLAKAHPLANVTTLCANVLEPLPESVGKFDSISAVYLLHCLAGPLEHKMGAVQVLKRHLNPGGVLFGATILGNESNKADKPNADTSTMTDKSTDKANEIVKLGLFARLLMKFYNSKGIFDNWGDNAEGVTAALQAEFVEVETRIVGRVLLWVARGPKEDHF